MDRSTADTSPHEANGLYDQTSESVNDRPVYAKRDSDLHMWWVKEAYVGEAPPAREGELQAENRDYGVESVWIVGSQGSVGTDRGCMYIKSSAQRPEQVVGKGKDNWHVAHKKEKEGWHWAKQRRFQSDITVSVHEDDDSNAVRWMDYEGGLERVEDREAVEKVVLLWWTTQLNVPRLRAALHGVPGKLHLDQYRKATSVDHLCRRLTQRSRRAVPRGTARLSVCARCPPQAWRRL